MDVIEKIREACGHHIRAGRTEEAIRDALTALAENVSDVMVQAGCDAIYPSRWAEKRQNEMRRAISAAIRAASQPKD